MEHLTLFLTVLVCTLVGVNAQTYGAPRPTQPPIQPGGLYAARPTPYRANPRPVIGDKTVTVTVQTIVTVPTYAIVTHTLQVTQTSDVRVTETLNTFRAYTEEVTERQTVAGAANTVTSHVVVNSQSLVVSTVRRTVPVVSTVTIQSTVVSTTTTAEYSTLYITHVDNVLTITVLPVLTTTTLYQVVTTTITDKVTRVTTSTVYPVRPATLHPTRPRLYGE